MERSAFPWRIVSLVAVLAGIGLFLAWEYGGMGRDDTADEAVETEGDAPRPPRDVASNPRASQYYARVQVCSANCVSEDRTCRGTADGAEEERRCGEVLEACRAACAVGER